MIIIKNVFIHHKIKTTYLILRLRCLVVVNFQDGGEGRENEFVEMFCPSFREVLALTCAAFLASSEITRT